MDRSKLKRRVLNLSDVEIEHLLRLLRDNSREGSYYGNPTQYFTRARRIESELIYLLRKQTREE